MKNILLALLFCTASCFAPLFVPCALSQNAASKQTAKETRHLGFHGIAVGQPISRLPFPCNDPGGSCEGIVDDNIVFVENWNSKVVKVTVGYVTLRSADKLFKPPPITLSQAVKLHSLQTGARPPALRYAGELYAGESSFVDLVNHIVYATGSEPSLAPEGIGKNRVDSVTYVSSGVPILEPAQSKSLGPAEASLLAEAKRSALYVPAAPITVPQLSTYMREVGLLYLETVERATEIDLDLLGDGSIESCLKATDIENKRWNEQLKTLKALEDRIEIHTVLRADKDFYQTGLKALSLLAEHMFVTRQYSGVLTLKARLAGKRPDDPPDKETAEASRRASDAIGPYVVCDGSLRTMIKAGEYDLDKLENDCKIL